MAKIHVPYSKDGMDLNIEDKNLLKVLTSKAHDFKPSKSESQLVEDSMDNPIGSKKLEELAVGKKNIVIITSDHTRPVPSKVTMPIILRRIRSVNKDAKIKILIANGFHRPTTKEELIFNAIIYNSVYNFEQLDIIKNEITKNKLVLNNI